MRPRSLVAALLLLGTACGGAGTTSAPPQAAPAQQTAPASPSAAPLQPTSAPAPTSAPQPQTAPAAPPTPGAAAPSYKGIPVGRLPEGFYTLGAPEAPVTLTDYSDFL